MTVSSPSGYPPDNSHTYDKNEKNTGRIMGSVFLVTVPRPIPPRRHSDPLNGTSGAPHTKAPAHHCHPTPGGSIVPASPPRQAGSAGPEHVSQDKEDKKEGTAPDVSNKKKPKKKKGLISGFASFIGFAQAVVQKRYNRTGGATKRTFVDHIAGQFREGAKVKLNKQCHEANGKLLCAPRDPTKPKTRPARAVAKCSKTAGGAAGKVFVGIISTKADLATFRHTMNESRRQHKAKPSKKASHVTLHA